MWRVLLKATKITIDTCRRDERVVGHLSSHACKVYAGYNEKKKNIFCLLWRLV